MHPIDKFALYWTLIFSYIIGHYIRLGAILMLPYERW